MLDPRIYRTGLIVTALALVVLAFSLKDQPGALNPTLAPDAFNGQDVYTSIGTLAKEYPSRRPGSDGDNALASQVATTLNNDGFTPTTTTFRARTVDGTRTLEDVVGVRPGMKTGSIVVVASRDALSSPAPASLSGTATLMELASDLQGETLNHTIVLASTSGSSGASGAIQLARSLPQPVDAVVVLGDLAGAHARQPLVIPWSADQAVAPPALRNTLASTLAAQTPFTDQGTGLAGQFAHLAFPLTLGQQAPFNAAGIPAVELSVSGEQPPGAGEAVSQATITGMGRAVLQTISALDGGPTVAAPSSYLLLSGKVVPGWAVSLFVLALLVPVAMTTVDGVARARRRGHTIWRSVAVILAAAVPFVAAGLVVLIARLVGGIGVAPPGPVSAGAVPLRGGGITVLILAGLAFLGSAWAVAAAAQRIPARRADARRRTTDAGTEGAVAGLLLVMCLVTFLIWLSNPFAALLVVPALHLWMWAISPDLRLPLPARAALIATGVVPAALVVVYYANGLGYGPLGLVWQATLLLAGHGVGLLAALQWCLLLGCLAGAVTLAVLAANGHRRSAPTAVTVRGPVTYAGPGSLGGTKSAMRR
jgi:hypothetical protein